VRRASRGGTVAITAIGRQIVLVRGVIEATGVTLDAVDGRVISLKLNREAKVRMISVFSLPSLVMYTTYS